MKQSSWYTIHFWHTSFNIHPHRHLIHCLNWAKHSTDSTVCLRSVCPSSPPLMRLFLRSTQRLMSRDFSTSQLPPLMSERCAQEDRTLSDYSWRTHDEPHDKSWDTEHTIRGTLQPTFYYKTWQSSIIMFKSRDYDSRMAHQSRSPFMRLRKPLIDVW